MKSVGWIGWHTARKEPAKGAAHRDKGKARLYKNQTTARTYSSGDSEREVFIKEASDQ